eukprot:9070910-Lingulodinium_polyedra.AAC.1
MGPWNGWLSKENKDLFLQPLLSNTATRGEDPHKASASRRADVLAQARKGVPQQHAHCCARLARARVQGQSQADL